MAELHEALKYLSPIEWDDLPEGKLDGFLRSCFDAGELLVNSVPLLPDGDPFESAKPHFEVANAARSAKECYASPARSAPLDQEHVDLQKSWGKPVVKLSAKENLMHTGLYRMAGNDRHGSWYARHSVIEGIGFNKFAKAMRREFPETLLTQGPPGAGAKRGLGAERRVERIDVPDVGRIEVYQLSGQMPNPVTPRDFLTLLLTTDQGLTDKSATDGSAGRHMPRHFMVVSRPLAHPDAPQRSGYVRGQYESVELIREIPLHVTEPQSGSEYDPELNPVEWIMVTRSDPAGGIPRFLVDRGTPDAMLTDITKFLDWACGQEEITDPDEDLKQQQQLSNEAGNGEKNNEIEQQNGSEAVESNAVESNEKVEDQDEEATPLAVPREQSYSQPQPEINEQNPGILTNLTSSLEAAMASYAPETVSSFVQRRLHTQEQPVNDNYDSDSSDDSFLSAEDLKRLATAPEYQEEESTENLSSNSGISSLQSLKTDKKDLNSHEKSILKIMEQREKLDQKLTKKRETEEAKFQQSQEKDQAEQDKARQKMQKELQKTEDRHRKEIEKLEAKRDKETRKVEERRKKRDDQNKLSLVARERDDLRSQADLLRRENALLAEQVENLQRENTALASKIGKIGGPDMLKVVQDEVKRPGSVKSNVSHTSLESLGSGEKKASSEALS